MNERAELWLLIGGAIAATYIWRLIGTWLAQKIDPNSNLFQWFTCVAYAMIAGLISRMLWLPGGPAGRNRTMDSLDRGRHWAGGVFSCWQAGVA